MCPLIEESEKLELQTAVALHAELTAALPELTVGLLHGRMKADEKAAVMDGVRRAARSHVLVATTVIEVGVDVPNASLMVIEHAERFGLAQLHQLRGRVGRGAAESTCYLLFEEPLTDTAKARLKVIYENNDGFEIARPDLVIRGPGEFLGARQSGVPLLRFADLERDVALIEQARDAAEMLLRRSRRPRPRTSRAGSAAARSSSRRSGGSEPVGAARLAGASHQSARSRSSIAAQGDSVTIAGARSTRCGDNEARSLQTKHPVRHDRGEPRLTRCARSAGIASAAPSSDAHVVAKSRIASLVEVGDFLRFGPVLVVAGDEQQRAARGGRSGQREHARGGSAAAPSSNSSQAHGVSGSAATLFATCCAPNASIRPARRACHSAAEAAGASVCRTASGQPRCRTHVHARGRISQAGLPTEQHERRALDVAFVGQRAELVAQAERRASRTALWAAIA